MGGSSVEDKTIRIESLGKSYGNAEILRDVSFELRDGEFLTLLGPSGSGKTTTLNIIAGFLDPSGDVKLGSRSLLTQSPRERNLGVVFQNYALFPHLSVADNVGFGLRMRNVAARAWNEQVAVMLGRVGLESYGHRKPSELSGGQQQQVALARALISIRWLSFWMNPLAHSIGDCASRSKSS